MESAERANGGSSVLNVKPLRRIHEDLAEDLGLLRPERPREFPNTPLKRCILGI